MAGSKHYAHLIQDLAVLTKKFNHLGSLIKIFKGYEMKDIPKNQDYIDFLITIKKRILSSQNATLKKINKELITLYLDIGQMIITRQKENNCGKAIVETLARDLQNEFPGIKGFSARNLWLMRTFYIEYEKNTKLQPIVAEKFELI